MATARPIARRGEQRVAHEPTAVVTSVRLSLGDDHAGQLGRRRSGIASGQIVAVGCSATWTPASSACSAERIAPASAQAGVGVVEEGRRVSRPLRSERGLVERPARARRCARAGPGVETRSALVEVASCARQRLPSAASPRQLLRRALVRPGVFDAAWPARLGRRTPSRAAGLHPVGEALGLLDASAGSARSAARRRDCSGLEDDRGGHRERHGARDHEGQQQPPPQPGARAGSWLAEAVALAGDGQDQARLLRPASSFSRRWRMWTSIARGSR